MPLLVMTGFILHVRSNCVKPHRLVFFLSVRAIIMELFRKSEGKVMISNRMSEKLKAGSLIRKMFEEGNRLKSIYGEDKVFDFSIGNPDVEPPFEVTSGLKDLINNPTPGMHGYMSNSGYLSTRQAVANKLTRSGHTAFSADSICMTVGAAGAMNATLRAILDPDDEVILLAPFFMEYRQYIDNHFGKAVIVPTDAGTFLPNIDRISEAITPRTKAIIINSPNNPTGAMYPASTLEAINTLVASYEHVIHIISDEPYRELVFDGQEAVSTQDYIDNLIICYSWSKSLSLPGERIGYTAVGPRHPDLDVLVPAITMANRILGSVNAPALFQKVIEKAMDAKVDVALYENRRNLLYDIVTSSGFTCQKPQGAFYLFVKSPDTDDMVFSQVCARHNLLVVPGSAFSMPGYFRLAFCVSESTIKGSSVAFRAVSEHYGLNPAQS